MIIGHSAPTAATWTVSGTGAQFLSPPQFDALRPVDPRTYPCPLASDTRSARCGSPAGCQAASGRFLFRNPQPPGVRVSFARPKPSIIGAMLTQECGSPGVPRAG